MTDGLETILARVASGAITAEQAEPLVAAAVESGAATPDADHPDQVGPAAEPWAPDASAEQPQQPEASEAGPRARRTVRLQVTERGRAMVDLRIPIGIAGLAGALVPGLSGLQADRIRDALRSGRVGPVLEVVDEDGDGVVISTE